MAGEQFELVQEGSARILAGLSKHLEDPKVLSALLLSMVVYTRANDIDSMLNKWIAYLRKQQGLEVEDLGLSRFQEAVALFVGGISGYGLALGVSRLQSEIEIKRLKDKYAAEMKVYNYDRPIWEANQAGTISKPEQAPAIMSFKDFLLYEFDIPKPEHVVLTFAEWLPITVKEWNEFSDEQKVAAIKAYDAYKLSMQVEAERYERMLKRWTELSGAAYQEHIKERQVAIDRYNRMLRRWNEIQNMPEPILPIPDPAIALWKEEVLVSQKDAATYALIAFIIGLNPSIVPEALKGVGEIVKGIGEIVPL